MFNFDFSCLDKIDPKIVLVANLTERPRINVKNNSSLYIVCNYLKCFGPYDLYFPVLNLYLTTKVSCKNHPPPRGCAGGRIGTRFLHPRGTSPLKGVNPAGTPGYRNGTESFFGLKGRPSVVRDV